jgi:hypothetical protein
MTAAAIASVGWPSVVAAAKRRSHRSQITEMPPDWAAFLISLAVGRSDLEPDASLAWLIDLDERNPVDMNPVSVTPGVGDPKN